MSTNRKQRSVERAILSGVAHRRWLAWKAKHFPEQETVSLREWHDATLARIRNEAARPEETTPP